MQRIFSKSEWVSVGKITIPDKKQIHHIKDVLRFKAGDDIEVFDDQGNVYRGVIESLTAGELVIKVKTTDKSGSPKDGVRITVACAIPKKSKMAEIVDKLTQLGVGRIIPMQTERVIVKIKKDKQDLRLARWNKIALNAVEQCHGCALPVIEPVKKFKEALTESPNYDLKLIPALIGERKELKSVLNNSRPKNILVLIGPEGDFTEGEVSSAIDAGFIPVTLGSRVLRVETAAVAVISYIRLNLGAPEHR